MAGLKVIVILKACTHIFLHSEPVNGIDPSGMGKLREFVIVGGIIGILAAITIQKLNPSPLPFSAQQAIDLGEQQSLGEILVECIRDHYKMSDIVIEGILAAGAIPISKQALGMKVLPGASRFTNPISLFGHFAFRGANLPFRVLGTRRVFGIFGRANIVVLSAFVTYDVTSLCICISRVLSAQSP